MATGRRGLAPERGALWLLLLAASAPRASAAVAGTCAGLEKKFPRSGSVVCCVAGCGECGGAACTAAKVPNPQESCCPGPIVRAAKPCTENDPGPCVLHRPGDPTCSKGILAADGAHCCPKEECGTVCGGEGCDKAPGGRAKCCGVDRRKDTPRDCSRFDPPCVLKPGASGRKAAKAASAAVAKLRPRPGAAGPLAGAAARGGAAVPSPTTPMADDAGPSTGQLIKYSLIVLVPVLIGVCFACLG